MTTAAIYARVSGGTPEGGADDRLAGRRMPPSGHLLGA